MRRKAYLNLPSADMEGYSAEDLNPWFLHEIGTSIAYWLELPSVLDERVGVVWDDKESACWEIDAYDIFSDELLRELVLANHRKPFKERA